MILLCTKIINKIILINYHSWDFTKNHDAIIDVELKLTR